MELGNSKIKRLLYVYIKREAKREKEKERTREREKMDGTINCKEKKRNRGID